MANSQGSSAVTAEWPTGALRMESHGVPNVIHITEQTAKRLAPKYRTESRGVIDIKGKGQMETFLLYP